MFKKLICLSVCVCLCSSLAGCGSSDNNADVKQASTNVKLSTELPDKEVIKEEPTSTPEPQIEYVVFSDAIIDNIKGYCLDKTNVSMTQDTSSYSLVNGNIDEFKKVASAVIDADLKNEITLSEITLGENKDSNVYYFADDNKNSIHLSKINNGDYIKSPKLSSSIKYDFNTVNDAYAFIDNISRGILPEKGTLGEISSDGKTYTFKSVRDAKESDISGTAYDSLGTTTVTFSLNKADDVLIPNSLSMDTTFYVGQNLYGVSTVCKFFEFSKKELKLPKYVKMENDKDKKVSNKDKSKTKNKHKVKGKVKSKTSKKK